MMIYRNRARILNPVTSLSAEQHSEIKRLAVENALQWSTSTGEHGALIGKFRAEVKQHYYFWQRRRCCYCSVELINHKITFDAEHILDKANYPEYMFDEGNIAVACKLCNQYKSNKAVSSTGLRFTELSKNTHDYSIVHPHLDEWAEHLQFDAIGRIVPVAESIKGKTTVSICGMESLNVTRLADQFAIEETAEAETALRVFHEVVDIGRKREFLSLLDEMAQRYGHPGARAVVEALRSDVQHLQSAQSPTPAVATLPVASEPHANADALPKNDSQNQLLALNDPPLVGLLESNLVASKGAKPEAV